MARAASRAVNRFETALEPRRKHRHAGAYLVQHRLLLAAEPAKKRIDQIGETRRTRIAPRLLDGEIDSRMIRHLEKQDLRRRHREDVAQVARTLGQRLVEEAVEDRIDSRQLPQAGIENGADQPPVSRVEGPISGVAMLLVQHAVEGGLLVDDGGQQLHRGHPGFQPGLCGMLHAVRAGAFRLPAPGGIAQE
jgi:hypothetical protein